MTEKVKNKIYGKIGNLGGEGGSQKTIIQWKLSKRGGGGGGGGMDSLQI